MREFLKNYLSGDIDSSSLEEIRKQKLNGLIEKAVSYGGIIEKDAIALQTGRYDYLSTNDKIRWLEKACNNAVYCGQYDVIELEKEIQRTPLF